jgi:hypothetical protein
MESGMENPVRGPHVTLRIYAHEWKYREAQRSRIGASTGA